MKDKFQNIHDKKLEDLINNLDSIGESVEGIAWLFTDGNFYKPGNGHQHPLCDIVAGYYDYTVFLGELKRSVNARDKAIKQINSAEYMVNHLFPGYEVNSKKIIYYGNGLHYETLP